MFYVADLCLCHVRCVCHNYVCVFCQSVTQKSIVQPMACIISLLSMIIIIVTNGWNIQIVMQGLFRKKWLLCITEGLEIACYLLLFFSVSWFSFKELNYLHVIFSKEKRHKNNVLTLFRPLWTKASNNEIWTTGYLESNGSEFKRLIVSSRHRSLFVGCLKTSQQHASVTKGQIWSDNFTCCHSEIEVADQTFQLTQSQYTDTWPPNFSIDPITPGAWLGSHWSAIFFMTRMTRLGKIPAQAGFEPGIFRSYGGRLSH